MNILFINNFRGRGGGEEFLADLLPGLIDKGVKVGLVCRPETPLVKMFQDSRVHLYPLSRSGKDAVTSVFKIGNIIRDEDYGIINIQRGHDIMQSWIAAVLSRTRPRLMYTVQVAEFKRSRVLLSRLDSIVAVSRYIKEKIASFCSSVADRISYINYGINTSRFSHEEYATGFLRNRYGIPRHTTIIGTVGDLWKNQIEFLDALAKIRAVIPDTRFAIAASASGREAQAFKERARSLGLADALVWAGRLSKEEMGAFYADIDLAVSTHRNEGFGIWILEALAMGKPVVAFNAGGIRDSLEGCAAGILVDGGTPEMTQEIIRVLQDEARYRQMAQDGPVWVDRKFTKERMVQDYYTLFLKLRDRSETVVI